MSCVTVSRMLVNGRRRKWVDIMKKKKHAQNMRSRSQNGRSNERLSGAVDWYLGDEAFGAAANVILTHKRVCSSVGGSRWRRWWQAQRPRRLHSPLTRLLLLLLLLRRLHVNEHLWRRIRRRHYTRHTHTHTNTHYVIVIIDKSSLCGRSQAHRHGLNRLLQVGIPDADLIR